MKENDKERKLPEYNLYHWKEDIIRQQSTNKKKYTVDN